MIIGDNVTNIPVNCFAGCATLGNVNIPNSVVTIESGAFMGCPLTRIIIEDGETDLNIGYYAEFGEHTDMFKDSNTQYLYLGRPVTGKGPAFRYSMYKLESVEFGLNINPIPDFIQHSQSLDTIKIHNNIPPEFSYSWGFSDQQYAKIKLEIPIGTLDEYKSHHIWQNFWNIDACLPQVVTGIDEIRYDENSIFNVYNLNGILIKRNCCAEMLRCLPKGIYLIRGRNVSYKIKI